MSKVIFITGGVISGTGKGISAASIGLLLKLRGHSVQYIKFDPYLNVNAGTMSPGEHGECFLCDDGSETDLDLGHIERITGINMSRKNITTSGVIFKELIEEEEQGKFLGETIQYVPHVTNKVQDKVTELANDSEILIVEIGGSVGDMESRAYYEAIRQYKLKHRDDVLVVMVAPILWMETIQELKTKPLQNSVEKLNSYGITTDILLCRTDHPIDDNILEKVSNMTSVPRECIFDAPDVKTIYQVPIEFYNRHLDDLIADKFHLKRNGCKINKYRDLVTKALNLEEEINIGVFGKYKNSNEAYISLKEALFHAGVANDVKINIKWVNAEELEGKSDSSKYFKDLNGVIIPGGFDSRGVLGKIKAIKYSRINKIPFLGLCLGLQCAVIEFMRNVCGVKDANSAEFGETDNPVIHFVEGQESIKKKSGTMRLGSYDCVLEKDTLAHQLYKKRAITERHRHRYEVNENYVSAMAEKNFIVSGRHPQSGLVEIMELKDHPYFIGTQAHPEFKSVFGDPAALFNGLVKAAILHASQSQVNPKE